MRECKIGVGGCGGHLYKTFLDYANELVGPVLKYELSGTWGYEKELVSRESEWKSLFAGLLVDLDLDEVEGLKPIQERDRNEDYYGGYYYIYGNKGWDKLPEELEDKMLRSIGYSMEDPGFIHRPELQMIAFAVPGVDAHICKKMYKNIKKVEFDSLFFFVGLGGGTGTGVISNITGYIRNEGKKTYPSFVLAALTGKNDGRIMRTQASFYRRSFNAIWALNDLLAGKKIDCVILVDNDKVPEIEEVKKELEKIGTVESKGSVLNRGVVKSRIPLLGKLKKDEGDNEKKSVIEKVKKNKGKTENEKNKGDLLNRYIIRSIFPLLGRNEFEYEQIDEAQWQREMVALSNFKPILIPCFWHGKMELGELIENAIIKGKLADCDHKTADAAYVITKGFWDDKKEIKRIVKERLAAAGVTLEGLKVEAWRTRKTGGDHKDKEVLVLLSNPDIKELIDERIAAAITFIELIQNNSDEVAIKRVREATSEFLKGQDLEDYVQRVRDEANEFLHIGDPYKFTEEAKEGKRGFIDDFKKELEKVKNRIENGEREIFKENIKIELGYLFSLDKKVGADLDRSVGSEISEELKKELIDKGVTLEKIKEVTKSGDDWVITYE
jgi:hypothetical protein